MRLYHAADIHLGRSRLDGRLPDEDLAAAFRHIAQAAVTDRADVFVLAGDLFDRPQVEPQHLRQAQEILQILHSAKIPVVAIEGNHDKASVHSDEGTWVGFLAEDGLVQLLRPKFGPNGAVLEPWDPATRRGGYIEYGGVRFIGAGYLGAATPAKVRQLIQEIDTPGPHVLLLHAGPDYFVGEGGGFSKEDLAMIREKIAYLALGHIHKPMLREGWACNPGSPENCDLREAVYSHDASGQPVNRGYAVVEIDPANPNQPIRVEIRSNPRRPVCRAELNCTPFGNKLKDGEDALVKAAVKAIASLAPPAEAVVELQLTGLVNLKRIALDPARLGLRISEEAGVFTVSLDPSSLNLGEGATGAAPGSGSELSREELERRAIRTIVGQQPVWGLEQEAFASLFFDLKEAVRGARGPEGIAEMIAANPLVNQIRDAKRVKATCQEAVMTTASTSTEPAP